MNTTGSAFLVVSITLSASLYSVDIHWRLVFAGQSSCAIFFCLELPKSPSLAVIAKTHSSCLCSMPGAYLAQLPFTVKLRT